MEARPQPGRRRTSVAWTSPHGFNVAHPHEGECGLCNAWLFFRPVGLEVRRTRLPLACGEGEVASDLGRGRWGLPQQAVVLL